LFCLVISEIKMAENGKQAVELLKAEALYDHPFDLILLDINMPGFTGIQVLKILRTIKAYEDTPVLMISTENEKEIVLEAIVSGANDYILKPFDFEVFKQKTSKYLS
ncbi:MAG: response regulator, partial [Deltaproteobacteria bacterium]